MILHLFAYLILFVICGFIILVVLAGLGIMVGLVLGLIAAIVSAFRALTGLDKRN